MWTVGEIARQAFSSGGTLTPTASIASDRAVTRQFTRLCEYCTILQTVA